MRKIALFLLFMTTVSLSAQTITLKDKSRKGDIFSMKWQSLQQSKKMGSMTLTYELDKIISESSEDQITARSKVKRLLVDISQDGATYRYDSKVKNPLSQMAKVLKKQFDPMAKVTIITDTDRYGKLIRSETIPPSQTNAIGGFQFYYPQKPIQQNSSWTSSYEDQASGTITLKYLVTKISDTTVFIDFNGNSKDMKTMKSKGTIEVDIKTGAVKKVTMKTEITAYGGLVKGKTTITSTKI